MTVRACVYGLMLIVSMAVCGCQTVTTGRWPPHEKIATSITAQNGFITTTAPNQLYDERDFERLNLSDLIDPQRRRCTANGGTFACEGAKYAMAPAGAPSTGHAEDSTELDAALAAFYAPTRTPSEMRIVRNRVQDRVLAASEQRCIEYKIYLQRVNSEDRSNLGVLTTVLGGAGAIVKGSSQVLSGLAGITSGIDATINQAFFGSLAVKVIVPGIDSKRAQILAGIRSSQEQVISKYTLESALLDAARYHGACSITSGLDQASEALNPGLATVGFTLSQVRNIRTVADPSATPDQVNAALSSIVRQPVSSAMGTTDDAKGSSKTAEADSPLAIYEASVAKIEAAFKDLGDAITARLAVVTKTVAAGKDGDTALSNDQKTALATELKILQADSAKLLDTRVAIIAAVSGTCLTSTTAAEATVVALKQSLPTITDADKKLTAEQSLAKARAQYELDHGAALTTLAHSVHDDVGPMINSVKAGKPDNVDTTLEKIKTRFGNRGC